MLLKDYLKQNNINAVEFSKRLGHKSHCNVYAYMCGRFAPSTATVAAIYKETGGLVTANDLWQPVLEAKGKEGKGHDG